MAVSERKERGYYGSNDLGDDRRERDGRMAWTRPGRGILTLGRMMRKIQGGGARAFRGGVITGSCVERGIRGKMRGRKKGRTDGEVCLPLRGDDGGCGLQGQPRPGGMRTKKAFAGEALCEDQ